MLLPALLILPHRPSFDLLELPHHLFLSPFPLRFTILILIEFLLTSILEITEKTLTITFVVVDEILNCDFFEDQVA